MISKHTYESALNSLKAKGAKVVFSPFSRPTIEVARGSLGNGSLGKLSYLKNYHRFIVVWVK